VVASQGGSVPLPDISLVVVCAGALHASYTRISLPRAQTQGEGGALHANEEAQPDVRNHRQRVAPIGARHAPLKAGAKEGGGRLWGAATGSVPAPADSCPAPMTWRAITRRGWTR
jgi:hypothetical protein